MSDLPRSQQSRPFWKTSLWQLLRVVVLTYALVVILLVLMEDFIVFHPSSASRFWQEPTPGLPVQDVELPQADGNTLHAWWVAPTGWQPADGAMLFCHGNGGNISVRAHALEPWLEQKIAVLLFDYPGFGRSTGSASEAGCYSAGDAFYDWLVEKKAVPANRVILYGGSLGTGVAVDLATRRPHRALILVSAYTSIPEMAQQRFPWVPGRWLARNKFNSLEKIGRVKGPVLIAQGPDDHLIPFVQGERLFEAAPEPKEFVVMPGFSHKDFPDAPTYPRIWQFLKEKAP